MSGTVTQHGGYTGRQNVVPILENSQSNCVELQVARLGQGFSESMVKRDTDSPGRNGKDFKEELIYDKSTL